MALLDGLVEGDGVTVHVEHREFIGAPQLLCGTTSGAGFLPAPERSPAGYRNYPESTVSVLRFIKRAQEMGFSLADVDRLLRLADGGADSLGGESAVVEDQDGVGGRPKATISLGNNP